MARREAGNTGLGMGSVTPSPTCPCPPQARSEEWQEKAQSLHKATVWQQTLSAHTAGNGDDYHTSWTPWWLRGKEHACQFRRRGFSPWRDNPLEKDMATQLQYS